MEMEFKVLATDKCCSADCTGGIVGVKFVEGHALLFQFNNCREDFDSSLGCASAQNLCSLNMDNHLTSSDSSIFCMMICDMVVIVRHLNVTLRVPELTKTSFWADSRTIIIEMSSFLSPRCGSDFQDIFDVDHFISSLRNEVQIVKQLPPNIKRRVEQGLPYSIPPISWSNISYYENQILPLLLKHNVIQLNRTDARLATNLRRPRVQELQYLGWKA
ncbi:hypothetical protein VNO77_21420 [Canavalia gladiata]|uniref:O-fucosyltransferase family protein n=1 Tax=Canavalia gladiata TaxID=3824 RepID=A0AAN9LR14_CANGL